MQYCLVISKLWNVKGLINPMTERVTPYSIRLHDVVFNTRFNPIYLLATTANILYSLKPFS